MQLVLSRNRVIAYGENFIAMGGTVVCNETGKAYANATITECDKIPCDIDTVGYEYHNGVFVPCAPYGTDNGEGYIMVACRECATPKNSGRALDDILGARLTVAAEFGSQIVCYKDNRVVYPKEKMEGLWWIDLPEYGEWTVKATLGKISGEQKINVTVLKEYFAYFGYGVKVTYPAGAVCTLTKGETVLTAPDTSGSTTFVVYDPGDWTVKATDGEKTVSVVVTVAGTENEMKIVKLNFAPEVRTTPESGVSYIEGISGLSWATLSEYSKVIAKSELVGSVFYLNDANTFYKISIGDTKTFTMDGSTYTARIIGFNHDDVTDGAGYGATKAGITFETVELYPTTTVWGNNGNQTWAGSVLRNAVISAYSKAETELKNVVVSVKKKYDDDAETTENTSLGISNDEFFVLSEMELSGTTRLCHLAEGRQYAYYEAGNSINAGSCWTRSTSDQGAMWRVGISGIDNSLAVSTMSESKGFSGAFCI